MLTRRRRGPTLEDMRLTSAGRAFALAAIMLAALLSACSSSGGGAGGAGGDGTAVTTATGSTSTGKTSASSSTSMSASTGGASSSSAGGGGGSAAGGTGGSACLGEEQSCTNPDECCSKTCTNGVCGKSRAGGACNTNGDCLGGACDNGTCSCALNGSDQTYQDPNFPVSQFTRCISDGDCCNGHCEQEPATANLPYGICCAPIGTLVTYCNECCTSTCVNAGPGVAVCTQDPGGDSSHHCVSDDECVSNECLPPSALPPPENGDGFDHCAGCFLKGHACTSDAQCCFGTCTNGACYYPTCTPDCAGKQCGSDGCAGACGYCAWADGLQCNEVSGQCEAVCTPSCAGRTCGPDGCGGSCGACDAGFTCSGGACVSGGSSSTGSGGGACPDWTSCLSIAENSDLQGCYYATPTNHCSQTVQIEICWQNTDGTCDCGESDIDGGATQSSAGWWSCDTTGHLRYYGTDPAGWGQCPTLMTCN